MLLVTVKLALVEAVAAFQSRVTVSGDTLRVGSPAACVMVQVASLPALSVTTSCFVFALIVPLAGILLKAMEKLYSAVAPGSPVIAAPLFVDALFAVYELGSVTERFPVPSENVSFDEFDVPVMVRVETPLFATDFVLSMVTNSGFPLWFTVRVTSATPVAVKVTVVERALRPVLLLPAVTLTVSLPEPLVLLGVSQLA